MITGPLIHLGESDADNHITDIHSQVAAVRQHYESIGLHQDELKKIIR